VKDSGGEPWFVARDVCAALEIKNMSDALGKLDEDEKGVALTDTLGGTQRMSTVSEPGLYALIMRSRKPEAHAFKRWVTHEVLPSIRKDGGYMVAREDESDEQVMARALLIAQKAITAKDKHIAELEPKARFADAVAASDGTCLVGELAKMLRQNGVDVGQNRLFAKLRDDGFLGKVG
jgi:anti-repressor protein